MSNLEFRRFGDSFISIDEEDNVFMMTDGIVFAPRAGITMSADCPTNIRDILFDAVGRGWIKPVATMRESDYLIAKLTHDE